MTDLPNPQDRTTTNLCFQSYLENLYTEFKDLDEGTVAHYIPELALSKPEWFGISAVTTGGKVFEVGNCTQKFTIQSVSKAFIYGLALEDWGREHVFSKVNVEPTGEAFNAIVLDEATNRPYNPLVNAGAIATTDLVKGDNSTERLKRILEMFRRYTGRNLNINVPIFLSEKATGHRNRAIAYLMLNCGMVTDRVDETLDLYFQQCSIMINARDLGVMAATLANGGVNPITGERAIAQEYVQDVLSVMLTCGMYDYSGEWAYRVGLPAKSGVGGGIVVPVPGELGIGTFSPPLDAKGNSVRGIQVLQALSQDFGLHMFNPACNAKDLHRWLTTESS